MDMKMVYTVKSIDTDYVNVAVSGTIELMAEGTISGDITINKDTGNVLNSNLLMDMEVQGQQMNMEVSMSSKKL